MKYGKKESEFETKELPEGWIKTTVGSIYTILGGGTPSTKISEYWNGNTPWITSADIHGLYDIQPRKRITQAAIEDSATNLIPANTIIVVTRVSLGKIALTKTPLCFSQDSQALLSKISTLDSNYVLYFLSQAVQIFKHQNRGTTISGVTKKQLSDTVVLLPPLPEQRRIASKIESIFAQIDACKVKLEMLAQQTSSVSGSLAQLKRSVLKQAFEGKLAPQDPNDTSMTSLFYKFNINFDNKTGLMQKIPNGWVKTTVGSIYTILGGGTPSTKISEYWNGNTPWITSADIHGLYDIQPRKRITQAAIEDSATNLIPANTIIVVTRVSLGKIALTKTPLCFSQDSQALLSKISTLDSNYVLYFLSQAVQIFKHQNRGTTISGVTKKQLADTILLLPPLPEQHRIVSKIESIFARIDATDRLVRDSLIRLDLLKKSVLKKAFEGRLVPQDPRDEPAEMLLQRIKQEPKAKEQ